MSSNFESLEEMMEERITIEVRPKFDIEPLATHYLRLAEGYDFFTQTLQRILGDNCLEEIYRLKEGLQGAKTSIPFAQELAFMKELLYGCYFNSLKHLGMDIENSSGEISLGLGEELIAKYNKSLDKWLQDIENDEDLGRDTRVIVPIGYLAPGKLTCWATLGLKPLQLKISYSEVPEVKVLDEGYKDKVDVKFESITFQILTDVFKEMTISKPLTREEFRQICDKNRTVERIV